MRIPLLAKALFWPALMIAFVLAVLPQGTVRVDGNDKLHHILAFFTLAVLGRLAFPAVKPLRIALALAGLGGLIEIVQMIPALNRDAEWMDFVADCTAIAIGLAFATRAFPRRFVTDPA